jgi:hypothetical protein
MNNHERSLTIYNNGFVIALLYLCTYVIPNNVKLPVYFVICLFLLPVIGNAYVLINEKINNTIDDYYFNENRKTKTNETFV